MRSSLGIRELVGRRELLLVLVERQLRLRSKRSIVGVAWPIVAPLLLLALYAFVFGRVFDVPVSDYPGFLFAGLLPWTFLVQSVHDGLQSISFEPELVRRAPFPYVYLPLARVIVMAGPFVLLLAGFVVWRAVDGELHADVLPLLLVPLVSVVLLVATLTMLLALLDVFNRDIRYVLNNVFTVWFFLAPIVYTQRMTEEHLEWLERVDPMAWVITQFRDILYWGRSPGVVALVALPVVSVAVFLLGLAVFRRATVGLAKYV
jgi:lipopolysaccharide transport system permease protein